MEYQIPLGRAIKIANVMAQRYNLEQELKSMYAPLNGDTSIQFIGHIFTENITWLKGMHDIDVFKTRITEGVDIGKELNILTPAYDDITLSDNEMKISLKILERALSEDSPCISCKNPNCIECVNEFDNLVHELSCDAECSEEYEDDEGFISYPKDLTKEQEEKFDKFFANLGLVPGQTVSLNKEQSAEFANLIEETFGINVFELEAEALNSPYDDDENDDSKEDNNNYFPKPYEI